MTDNSTHLSGDEAPASTSDSPQTAVATPPKRVNFPLPRELRDQIYGYLLHHEFTEHSKYPESDTQDAGLPSSYKFHTSILAVNTQIGREATEVLRSNDFVQVTTPWPVVIDLKALEVPIVCDLASRNHHFDHLRIDYKLHVHSPRIPSDRERRLVVVRFGLIKFCRFLQFNLLGFPPFGPVVLFGTGSKEKRPPQVIWNLDEQYKITSAITVHDKIGKPLSTTAKRRLLEPFRNLIIGGQSMEINTILPEHELATFKLFVAPPVMNSLPMTWRSFELALEMKAVADRHVLTGHSTQATRLYRDISYAVSAIPRRNGRGTMVLDMLCALVSVDISLCLALINLTISRPTDAETSLGSSMRILREKSGILQALFPKIDSFGVKGIIARQMAVQWLAMIYRVARSQSPGSFVMTRYYFEQKKNVRDIMALNNHEEVADYFDHDVNYLKGLNSQDDGTAVKQIFDQSKLSLFQLPPLVFNFPLPDGWSKPVGWFGFLDREIYEVMLNNGLVSAP
ncbi:hypothetical protein D0869_14879 [Hortaea werneckii]|uniref:Uncharacterized protein n=1 Tax=Hortaea werneckii TaxID=91943 RepID=A0A3M6W0Z6_HORWE|nr:hypothetical protein D0869_14879 [Hortaea werneckii]RMX87863.1 hypothetical protein D0868_14906 [Hortaea werneckii]RMX93524.1 hypothetical protein D0867_14176 [Hortaea werneckii]RMY28151.1 hypothetical protein D0866_09631 [Hortaea werneckii]